MRILIIEDNDVLRGNIKTYLELQGHTVDEHTSYQGASYQIIGGGYDAIILDLGLGSDEGDGLDVCRAVREEGSAVPILMLTARTMTEQKIEGLQSGADDYIVKPFDYKELVARIEAVVRRDQANKGQKIVIDDIEILEDKMQVLLAGKEVDLSKLEFKLLVYLAKHRGKILSKETLMEKVWGEVDLFKESRTVDIYVGYLRKKLRADAIETVRGVGYIIH